MLNIQAGIFSIIKYVYILVLVSGLYSCNNGSSGSDHQTTIDSTKAGIDTLNSSWIEDFREFRNAVYFGNISKVKTYFKFPISDEYNGIWAIAQSDWTKSNDSTIIPFTEKHFDKYYNMLFTKEFIKSILKIKSEELFLKNSSSSGLFVQDSITNYMMTASVDKTDKILHLVLLFDTEIKDESGDSMDGGESGIGYIFIIQNNGRLLFKGIQLAG